MALRVLIAGCTGRMGRELLRLSAEDANVVIAGATTEAGHASLGQDAGTIHGLSELGVAVRDEFTGECDVVIEFTLPDACAAWADWCGEHAVPLVSGTTGLTAAHESRLSAAASKTAVLRAANMSLGANLLARIAGEVAAAFGSECDIEVVETHHNRKIDAPSGTALAIVRSICDALGRDPGKTAVVGRSGVCGPRRAGEIGVHSLRMGNHVGEHEVHFSAAGETITLRHRAHERGTFAAGALRAAHWLAGKPPGSYTIWDVLDGQ